MEDLERLVRWFRHSSPFIHAHRGRTFVVHFGGEALLDPDSSGLIHDLALLSGLGVRLVIVPGARPQIEQRLAARGAEIEYVNGLRITDTHALSCVCDAVGSVRLELEALFSMSLVNSPMAGLRLQAASGNFVTARPLGVCDGIDYQHTGEVRRIDAAAIRARLDDGAVVLVSPVGVSPTGEQFNLYAEDVAVSVARALQADKLLFLHEGSNVGVSDEPISHELTVEQALRILDTHIPHTPQTLPQLRRAVEACRGGVARVHLVPRSKDGALLGELFTRDGVGTLVTPQAFEQLRAAKVDDISGILALIEPLEEDGTLIRRTRDRIESELDQFMVMEREGTVVACAALQPVAESDLAEVACLTVHPDYQRGARGRQLLEKLEEQARQQGCRTLFVLTTRTEHWFREQGFEPGDLSALPTSRQAAYQPSRASKLLIKPLLSDPT